MMIALIEVLVLLATAILAVLWAFSQNQHYEPYIVILGCVGVAIDLIRRYLLKKSPKKVVMYNLNSKESILNSIHQRDLSDTLLTVIGFAKKTKNIELERWAKLELHGWTEENGMFTTEFIPEYRSVPILHYDQYGRHLTITQKDLNFINETRIRSGIREIEGEMSIGISSYLLTA
jgi:AbiTii